MINEFIISIVSGWVGAALAYIAIKTYTKHKATFDKKHSKFTYFRIIRLRNRERGDQPYYVRHHHTINIQEPVFDETWSLNGSQCNRQEVLEPIRLSSKGIVDAIQIFPTLSRDADNHPHSRESANLFIFSCSKPTDRIAAVGTMINGMQVQEDWWYGTTSQYEGQDLVLILDFSGLPYEVTPIKNVRSILERDRKVVPKEEVYSQWHEEKIENDIFYLRFINSKKDDVIKFEFEITWGSIPLTVN